MVESNRRVTRPWRLLSIGLPLLLLAVLFGGSGTVLSNTFVSGLIVDSDTTTIRRPESYGKPHQTRIWYNPYADRWDALVPKDDGGGTSASDHYILLDVDGAQTFTGVELQDRDFSRSDIYWDAANKKLYALASHPTQSQFWRLGYDDVNDQYALEVGVPGTGIDVPGWSHPDTGNGGNSAATIGVSPDGAVWAAVMKDGTGLQVQYSADGGATWLAAPITLDATTRVGVTTWVTFKQGDAFYQGLFAGENGEGGSATEFFFWTIEATADPTVLANWSDESANIPAPIGVEQADDHVSAARDQAGNLYFAVKTEGGNPTDPLIKLYQRTPDGAWSQYKVSEVQAPEELSRPSLVVDNTHKELYVFANGGEGVSPTERDAGFFKVSLNSLATLPTASFNVQFSQANTVFTDIITPREAVDGRSGIVVLAHNRTDKNVWYSAHTLGDPPSPTPTDTPVPPTPTDTPVPPTPTDTPVPPTPTDTPVPPTPTDTPVPPTPTDTPVPPTPTDTPVPPTPTDTPVPPTPTDTPVPPTPTATPDGQEFTLTAVQDTILLRALPYRNFGTLPILSVGSHPYRQRRTVVRFDFDQLPPGASVNAAAVNFYVVRPTDDPIHIYRVTDDWQEESATWRNTAYDFDRTTVHGTLLTPDAYTTAAADITGLVQSWLCGETNDGLMLIAAGDEYPALFLSRESGWPETRPTLELSIAPGNANCN